MLKIGDFSKLSRITVRMLRHYDEIGLLVPLAIDERSGYRYYGEEQLLTANKIQLLKNLGFSLFVIKEALTNFNNCDEMEKLLKLRQKELLSQEYELCKRIKLVESALKNLKKEGNFMNYVVNFKTIPPLYVASARKVIANYMAEGELWATLMPEIEKQKCKAATPCYPMAVYHDKEFVDKNADVEVRFAVTGSYNDTANVKFKTVPQADVASCIFKGGYDQIAAVNQAIAKWAIENGYEFNGAAFWIYHKSPYETKNPQDYVTEVCFPVRRREEA